MRSVWIAPQAQRDIGAILSWSGERFGVRVRARYKKLIETAICDVASDPERPGSRPRPDLGDDYRVFHLSLSRERARESGGSIRRPRHFLLYRLLGDDRLEIGRVLHDSMDLPEHVPAEHDPLDDDE